MKCEERADIIFKIAGRSQRLRAGQLVYLLPDEPHALITKTDSILLLTIIF